MLDSTRTAFRAAWSETSFRMQRLRDNPECAAEERARATDPSDPGLFVRLSYDPAHDVAAPFANVGARPRVAVLREQGVNSQLEMAAALHRAGFTPHDVHMTDLIGGRVLLGDFKGLVACGGFSYGDVLGAGEGWAKSILFNTSLREQFAAFFERPDSFTLGVCNGCQMLSALKSLVPGAAHWPRFVRNRSEQFEGRFGLVEVLPSPSLFFAGMAGSVLPVAIAHGEGRAEFGDGDAQQSCLDSGLISLRYVDNHGRATESYPANPNGSPGGLTGLTSVDGRATILMPHPERVFRAVQNSWLPAGGGEDSGWMRFFRNARVVGRVSRGSRSVGGLTGGASDGRDLVRRFVREETPHHRRLLQLAAPDIGLVQDVLEELEQHRGLVGAELRQRRVGLGVGSEEHLFHRREGLGVDLGHLARFGDLVEGLQAAVLAQIVEHGLRGTPAHRRESSEESRRVAGQSLAKQLFAFLGQVGEAELLTGAFQLDEAVCELHPVRRVHLDRILEENRRVTRVAAIYDPDVARAARDQLTVLRYRHRGDVRESLAVRAIEREAAFLVVVQPAVRVDVDGH